MNGPAIMASSCTCGCSLLLEVRILFVKGCEALARMAVNLNVPTVAHPCALFRLLCSRSSLPKDKLNSLRISAAPMSRHLEYRPQMLFGIVDSAYEARVSNCKSDAARCG